MKIRKISFLLAAFVSVLGFAGVAGAASNSDFTQTINAGVLATDIKNSSLASVASPSVAMSPATTSFDCQYVGSGASTGIFGTNSERIYVSNPGAVTGGWGLTVAADNTTDTWTDGGTNSIDFNDPSGSSAGCSDGGSDADTAAGQMSLDFTANPATITTDCSGQCSSTGVTLGSNAAFSEGTVDEITLINAASGSDDIWRGYLQNVRVNQTIPAQTPATNYNINLVLTATAQ